MKLRFLLAYKSCDLENIDCDREIPQGEVDVLKQILGENAKIYPGIFVAGGVSPIYGACCELEVEKIIDGRPFAEMIVKHFSDVILCVTNEDPRALQIPAIIGDISFNAHVELKDVVKIFYNKAKKLFCKKKVVLEALIYCEGGVLKLVTLSYNPRCENLGVWKEWVTDLFISDYVSSLNFSTASLIISE